MKQMRELWRFTLNEELQEQRKILTMDSINLSYRAQMAGKKRKFRVKGWLGVRTSVLRQIVKVELKTIRCTLIRKHKIAQTSSGFEYCIRCGTPLWILRGENQPS